MLFADWLSAFPKSVRSRVFPRKGGNGFGVFYLVGLSYGEEYGGSEHRGGANSDGRGIHFDLDSDTTTSSENGAVTWCACNERVRVEYGDRGLVTKSARTIDSHMNGPSNVSDVLQAEECLILRAALQCGTPVQCGRGDVSKCCGCQCGTNGFRPSAQNCYGRLGRDCQLFERNRSYDCTNIRNGNQEHRVSRNDSDYGYCSDEWD